MKAKDDANRPEMIFTFQNFSQPSSLIKSAKIIIKIKKNNEFKSPPALVGDPKILNLTSCENIVDKIRTARKEKIKRNGIKARFFLSGMDMEYSFLQRNLKRKKDIKSVNIILNKINLVQSEGWNDGGKTIIGRNRIMQIPQNSQEILF